MATIGSAPQRASVSRLSSRSSGTASITRSAPSTASSSVAVAIVAVRSTASLVEQPGVDVPARALQQPLARGVGQLGRRVDEPHLQPRAREVPRDAAAHRAAAEHRNNPDRHDGHLPERAPWT